MTLIWTIIIGFVVGLIARTLRPGRDSMGFVFTTLLGIVGAIIAQLSGQAIGWYHEGEPAGFIASVVGAMVVLWIGQRVQKTTL